MRVMEDVDIFKTKIDSSTLSTPTSLEEAKYLASKAELTGPAYPRSDDESPTGMGVPDDAPANSGQEVGLVSDGLIAVGGTEEGGSSFGRRSDSRIDQSIEGISGDGRGPDGGDTPIERKGSDATATSGRSEKHWRNDGKESLKRVASNNNNRIGTTENEGALRRKKHRRGKSKKRKWKPYNKLTWEEKRVLEHREAQRALRVRAEMFAHGRSVAPYNTTQFLMEDHNVNLKEPDLALSSGSGHNNRQRRDSNGASNVDDSDHFYSSPEDEEEFMQKEFSEAYDNIHAERLSTMTKAELIQEYLQLEDRIEKLEQQQRDAPATHEDQDPDQVLEKVRIFHEEIRKLHEENQRLREENAKLQAVARGSP